MPQRPAPRYLISIGKATAGLKFDIECAPVKDAVQPPRAVGMGVAPRAAGDVGLAGEALIAARVMGRSASMTVDLAVAGIENEATAEGGAVAQPGVHAPLQRPLGFAFLVKRRSRAPHVV